MGKETDLLNAVRDGNGQFVRKTLQKYRKSSKKGTPKKSHINVKDSEGFTALHHAALSGDVDMVVAIVEMEGDPNGKDIQGMTPVHLAAWAGKDNTVKALLEINGLPNLPSNNGDTPLHLASQHGYAQCAKILLERHADPSVRNHNSETPLDLACQFGHTSVVRQLLNNEKVTFQLITPERHGKHKSPLHLASKSGHDDIVHLLLQAGANVNDDDGGDGTPLHLASLYGKINVVRLLLQAGAEVHKCNKNGLVALDLVNRFTTSRAGLDIKQMLREAAGERVVYATAVSDYHNQYDDSCLSFKTGDSIAVIEQNENGRWRGYVVNEENETIGYFPAMAVHLTDSRKPQSTSSRTSSMTSSDSLGTRSFSSSGASPRRSNGPKSPDHIPVGVVPIGNFEVVTLAQNDTASHAPPKQTASGSLPPRMSSFKKSNRPPHLQTPPSDPAPPPPQAQHLPPAVVQNPPASPRIITAQKQTFKPAPPPKGGPSRSFSEKLPYSHQNGNVQNRDRASSKINRSSSETESRGRTSSSGSAQYELAKALRQGLNHTTISESEKPQGRYIDIESVEGNLQQRSEHNENTNYTTVAFNPNETHHNNNVNTQHVNNKNGSFNNNGSTSSDNQQYNNSPDVSSRMKFSPGKKSALTKTQSYDTNNHISYSSDSNSNHVKFALNNEQLNSPSLYENISTHRQADPIAPQLPLKRAQTLPKNHHNRVPNNIDSRNDNENDNVSVSSSTSSSQPRTPTKQRLGQQYENTSLMSPGSRSPRSIHGVNAFPIQQYSPDSTDGSFPYPLDAKLSKSDQELLNWLTELKLVCYFDNFKSQGFDMVSVRAITPEDLTQLEITKTGHRKKLLSEIAKLPPTDQLSNTKPHDVASWLANLGLLQYEPNFVEGGFDDIDFIKDLDRNDLEMIDIKKTGHQKKLIMAVQRLNELELTEVLDIAVAESPIKRTRSFNNNNKSAGHEVREFFPDPPIEASYTVETMSAPSVEELPPPPSQQNSAPPPVSSKPNGVAKKAPVPVPPKPRKASVPLPPAAKPKPKPSTAANKIENGCVDGTLQGSQEEVVKSSKSRDFFKQVEQKALKEDDSPTNTMERRASHSERRTSYTERNSPRKVSLPPPTASKPRSNSSSSDSSDKMPPPPVAAKKAPPPAPPKRAGSLPDDNVSAAAPTPSTTLVSHLPPTQETPEDTPEDTPEETVLNTTDPSPRLPTFKPPPPPTKAPPVDSTPELPPAEVSFELPPPELELPPPPPDTPSSLDTSLPEPSFSPPPPPAPVDDLGDLSIQENNTPAEPQVETEPSEPPPPLVIEPISLPERRQSKDEFAETDDIMDQLMNDLDDFTKDLDNMF